MFKNFSISSPEDFKIKYNPYLDVDFVRKKDAILFRKGSQWQSTLETEFAHINKVTLHLSG